MNLPHSWQMSDEQYMEYHEPPWELYGESEPKQGDEGEEDTGDCKYCKHDAYCKGGCKLSAPVTPYKFERKKEECQC